MIPQTHSVVLITYRPEYRGALANVPGAQTISLTPLSDSETTALLDEVLGSDASVAAIKPVVAERAAGNPFFDTTMIRSPLAVLAALFDRLGRMNQLPPSPVSHRVRSLWRRFPKSSTWSPTSATSSATRPTNRSPAGGETMTTAAIAAYTYDQIDQARIELNAVLE